ncbi:helix-turn-helix domain-containing protein [Candidatus Microgenomates bacterium]|nr:helix-turn-helix domain-containing protein [Candidatus Microgenomates bacterium]
MMEHLINRLRETKNPQDEIRADVIEAIKNGRGSDIDFPPVLFLEPKHFGSMLKTFRELTGMNQTDFAELVPCDQTAISKLETGRRRPSLTTTLALSRALNLPQEIESQFLSAAGYTIVEKNNT